MALAEADYIPQGEGGRPRPPLQRQLHPVDVMEDDLPHLSQPLHLPLENPPADRGCGQRFHVRDPLEDVRQLTEDLEDILLPDSWLRLTLSELLNRVKSRHLQATQRTTALQRQNTEISKQIFPE